MYEIEKKLNGYKVLRQCHFIISGIHILHSILSLVLTETQRGIVVCVCVYVCLLYLHTCMNQKDFKYYKINIFKHHLDVSRLYVFFVSHLYDSLNTKGQHIVRRSSVRTKKKI